METAMSDAILCLRYALTSRRNTVLIMDSRARILVARQNHYRAELKATVAIFVANQQDAALMLDTVRQF